MIERHPVLVEIFVGQVIPRPLGKFIKKKTSGGIAAEIGQIHCLQTSHEFDGGIYLLFQ